MMRYAIAAFAIFAASLALAQQSATPEQYQAVIQALRQQREAANDQAAQLGAQVSLLNKDLAELKAKAEAEKKPASTDEGK